MTNTPDTITVVDRNELNIFLQTVMVAGLERQGFDASMFQMADAAACFYEAVEAYLAAKERNLK